MIFVAQANAAHSDSIRSREARRWASQRDRFLRSTTTKRPGTSYLGVITRASFEFVPALHTAPFGRKVVRNSTPVRSRLDRFWPAAAQNGASMRAVRPRVRKALR